MIPIGGRTSLLTIASVQPEHLGNFTCSVSNRAGVVSHTSTLFINGILFTVRDFLLILFLFLFI